MAFKVIVSHLCRRSIVEFLSIFLHIVWSTFRFFNCIVSKNQQRNITPNLSNIGM